MSGSFEQLDVPPTLVSFAVGMGKASQIGTAAFRKEGSLVAYLPLPVNADTRLPDWPRVRELLDEVAKLVQFGVISSAFVGAGGRRGRRCGPDVLRQQDWLCFQPRHRPRDPVRPFLRPVRWWWS